MFHNGLTLSLKKKMIARLIFAEGGGGGKKMMIIMVSFIMLKLRKRTLFRKVLFPSDEHEPEEHESSSC